MTVSYEGLPGDLVDQARAYIDRGECPGKLLTGCLAGDLRVAYEGMCGRQDGDLMAVLRWVRWECPSAAAGSLAAVRKWCAGRLVVG